MKKTMANSLLSIQQFCDEKLALIFHRTEKDWEAIRQFLKQKNNIHFFNGECYLSDVIVNGMHSEAIVILNEQNVDNLVVFNARDKTIDVYAFKHYYNEADDDCSLLEDLMMEKNFIAQTPIITISNKSEDKASYIQYYNELYSFHISVYESICMEMGLDNQTQDNEKIWSELTAKTHKMFEKIFKSEKDRFINLYLKVKNKSKDILLKDGKVYVERIKVKELDEEEDSIIDDVFEKVFGTKINSSTKEAKEADCYRDALILDNGNVQFVAVFHVLDDNDLWQSQDISLYYCSSDDERFTTLSFLISNFQHLDNYPIYTIKFNRYKDTNKTFYSSGSYLSDVRYFSFLSGFLMELDDAYPSN